MAEEKKPYFVRELSKEVALVATNNGLPGLINGIEEVTKGKRIIKTCVPLSKSKSRRDEEVTVLMFIFE